MKYTELFSKQAKDYALYRPKYPNELFDYLFSLTTEHELAWDCATGNGQTAVVLAKFFERVIATDSSESQLAHAQPQPNIDYRIALAEDSGLDTRSIDLLTVSSAVHWFDFDKFYTEVRRVLKSNGVLAVWGYGFLSAANPDISEIYRKFYYDIVGPYWPAERKYFESEYKTIPFPFEEVVAPQFFMTQSWDLDHLLGYLSTWSSTQKFMEVNKTNPTDLIQDEFARAWLDPKKKITLKWPIYLRVARVS